MECHMVINEYLCQADKYPKNKNEQTVIFKNLDILAAINNQ